MAAEARRRLPSAKSHDHRHQQRRPAGPADVRRASGEALECESIYAYNAEAFGPACTLAGASKGNVVIAPDLRAGLARLILNIQDFARDRAIENGLTARDLLAPGLMNGDIAV